MGGEETHERLADGSRPRRPTRPRLSFAVFFAVMLACFGLHVLLASGVWWVDVVAVAAITLGVAALVRARSRGRFLPTVVAVLVLAAYLVFRFAADTTTLLLPGGDTLERFRQLIAEASASIYVQAIPASVGPGILFLVVAGVGVLAIITDFLVLGLRTPALSAIALFVPFALPAAFVAGASDGFAFVLAAAGYLYLLLAARSESRVPLAISSGVLAIVVALVVPWAMPPVAANGDGAGGLATGINPTIELGHDLKAQSDTPVLSYTTRSGNSHYLRLVTLDKFSGSTWTPAAPKPRHSNDVAQFAAPEGLSAGIAVTQDVSQISVANLQSPWLPLPYPPASVADLSGDWYWANGTLAVSSPDADVAGQKYTVTSLAVHPTPEQLSAAGNAVPSSLQKYLSLPDDLPAVISDTAREVVDGESSNYAKAVALQEYFRSDAFEYSVDAPISDGYDGTGMAVIAKFLDVKKGYCVHFASAMAVMARSLGIPSRIAVGFQGGTAQDGRSAGRQGFAVTSNDLHAWPELYFDTIGWVPFEPTPGRGSVPSYADQTVEGVPAPLSPAALAARSTATPDPAAGQNTHRDEPGDASVDDSSAARSIAAWSWSVGISGLVILLIFSPAVARVFFRNRRLRVGTAETAWREVMMTAEDVGITIPATLTPREVERALTVSAGAPLERLRIAIERESYAASSAHQVDAADVRSVRDRLLAAVSRRRRLLARLAPPSSWKRLGRRATITSRGA